MRGHIRKRGNKYSIVIDIGRDHLGKRKQKWFSGFDKKKEAEKELPKLIQQLELGEIVASENMSFADYMEKWLERKKKNVTYGTYRHYEAYSRNHIIPSLGKWQTNKVKDYHIASFMDSLEDKGLSKRTQRHIYRILSSAISSGAQYGLNKNLLSKTDAPKVPKKKIEFWNEEEVQTFLESLFEEKHYMPIYLALMTGMRQGEVLGLRWDSIDLDQRILSVQQQLKIKEVLDVTN
ncbi:hypothetical protein CHH49_03950 [Terribacillus saccharophilus]|uniref:site-specific integrase n=1 Tax=Terribacillus saccharophilus TaxID=361277 RepID=UPI000BA57CBC|nr:Arm DNA-binding domain-containing protein [Terribacillus saccharophilus]PAF22748.1 hypothetical protein CHH49_03950 [Terribacillus saccharophilus]